MFSRNRGCFTLTPSLGLSPANIQINFTSLETRTVLMLKTARPYLHSYGQNTGMWRTDGRTDGQTELLWLLQRSALRADRKRTATLIKKHYKAQRTATVSHGQFGKEVESYKLLSCSAMRAETARHRGDALFPSLGHSHILAALALPIQHYSKGRMIEQLCVGARYSLNSG